MDVRNVWFMGCGCLCDVAGSVDVMTWRVVSRPDICVQRGRMQEAIRRSCFIVCSCAGARGSAIRVSLRRLHQGGDFGLWSF